MNVCLNCHTEQAEQGKKHVLHQPAFGQGCATCHEPHGGDNEHLLRAQGNALCLECHGPDSQPQKLEAEHVLTIFNGKVKLPETTTRRTRSCCFRCDSDLGIRWKAIRFQDVLDPKDITKVKTPLNCLTCHQPHFVAADGLLVKDQENNMAFCDTCHKNRIDMTQVRFWRKYDGSGTECNESDSRPACRGTADDFRPGGFFSALRLSWQKKKKADPPLSSRLRRSSTSISRNWFGRARPRLPGCAICLLRGHEDRLQPAREKEEAELDGSSGRRTARRARKSIFRDFPFQLLGPYGIAIDSKGLVYVADQKVGAIFIFNTETRDVQLIRNGYEAHFGLDQWPGN